MNRTMTEIAVCLLFSLSLDVPRMQAQRPMGTEPQAPSSTLQSPREVVPALPVPRLVKFAGMLNDEQGKPRTGVVGVTFTVYKEQEGGAALWMETQNVQLDEQGHYAVLLGATKGEGLPLELFSAGEPRWLGVQVNLPREVEQPRVLLVSVPYALKAVDAETVGGMPASAFALAAPSGAASGASGSGTSAQTSAKPKTAGKTATGASVPAMANFIPVFLDNTGTNLGSSPMFQSGANIGLGTTTPAASLDVQLTTAGATNALNSTITLNNSTPITGSVLSAFKMTLLDKSTAANLSKQPARFVYLRDASATGGVTAFDSVMTATSFLSANAPYSLRGVNIEGPSMATGTTLNSFTGLYVGSPPGPGTVTNKFALVTEPNAGLVGIGTTTPFSILHAQNGATTLGSCISFGDAVAGECNTNGCSAVDAITDAPNAWGVFAAAPGPGSTAVEARGLFHVNYGNNWFRVDGPVATATPPLMLASFGGSGDFAIDAVNVTAGRFVVKDTTGDVGIGIPAPGQKLDVNGNIRTNSCYLVNSTVVSGTCVSDARLKTNIRPFSPVIDKLARLRPVHFDWRVADYPERHFDSSRSAGLIAQEVEKVLPELVSVDDEGFKQVNYTELPYLMLQAIRELKAKNDRLQSQIEELRAVVVRIAAQQDVERAAADQPRPVERQ